MPEERYVFQVERTLKQLRRACLGLDTPFRAVLPSRGPYPPDKLADTVSRELVFAMCRWDYLDDKEITAVTAWLRAAIRFIVTDCNAEEHCFSSLTKLTEQSVGILPLITRGAPERPEVLTTRRLETAVVSLLMTHDLLDKHEALLLNLQGLAEETN